MKICTSIDPLIKLKLHASNDFMRIYYYEDFNYVPVVPMLSNALWEGINLATTSVNSDQYSKKGLVTLQDSIMEAFTSISGAIHERFDSSEQVESGVSENNPEYIMFRQNLKIPCDPYVFTKLFGMEYIPEASNEDLLVAKHIRKQLPDEDCFDFPIQ